MKKLLLICLAIFAFANDGEYVYKNSSIEYNSMDLNQFFNDEGAPDIYFARKCSKGKHPVCWPIVKNNYGKILASYGSKDSVSKIMKSRYQNIAYLLYEHSYKVGKKYKREYFLIDNNGHKYTIPPHTNFALSSIITDNAQIIQIYQNRISYDGLDILIAPTTFTQAKLTNNLKGNISAIAIDTNNEIYVTNLQKFVNTKVKLAIHGDRENILASYPVNKQEVVWSVYKYVNSYNKGLLLGDVDFKNNENVYGWLVNSEIRNIGFDPEIYVDNGIVYVATTDSTNRDNIVLKTAISDIENMKGIIPKNIIGFEDEKSIGFLVGTSFSYLYWYATNEVKAEDGVDYGDVKYDISSSMYQSIYLQGRMGDTQVALTYMKNKAEAKGAATEKASKFLNAVVDFNSFFNGSSTLRILAEKGEVNGIANWNGEDIYGVPVINRAFSTKVDRYAALVIREQGYYYGLDYTQYKMPSLLGFSKDGNTKFVLFDPKAQIHKLTIDFGYDELSYAKRYENDFNRWYIQGLIGVGFGYVSMSNDSYANQEAKDLGYDGIDTPITLAIDYGLDFGYIFQRKAKVLRGFGFSTQIGIKAKGTYFMAGTSSKNDNDNEDNKLNLEFERNDIWYGPYITFNLVF